MTDAGADLTGETVELLQQLIRNRCVNDGTPESGQEVRNADLLRLTSRAPASTSSATSRRPGGGSLVARIEGADPTAPTLCLMGHTDVVPVNAGRAGRGTRSAASSSTARSGAGAPSTCSTSPRRWRSRSATSPAAGSGRGATSSSSPSPTRRRAARYGARVDGRPRTRRRRRRLRAHRERAALPSAADGAGVVRPVGEKGVAWRRLRVRGTPGHGSMPFGADNALRQGGRGRPPPRRLPPARRSSTSCGAAQRRTRSASPTSRGPRCSTRAGSGTALRRRGDPGAAKRAPRLRATRRSRRNVVHGGMKTNIIPDRVDDRRRHPHPARRGRRRRRPPPRATRSAIWPRRGGDRAPLHARRRRRRARTRRCGTLPRAR